MAAIAEDPAAVTPSRSLTRRRGDKLPALRTDWRVLFRAPVDFRVDLKFLALAATAAKRLGAQAFRAGLEDPATAALHEAALQEAHRRGAFGVPSVFLGDHLFWGNDRPVLVEYALRKAQASAP